MRLIHAADIHLDSPLRSHDRFGMATASEMRGATRRALELLVSKAIEWRAHVLVIAGDLYDGTWNDYGTGLFFSQQMGVLRDAGIQVVIASGNHDAQSEITATLSLPPNVTRLDVFEPQSVTFDDLGCVVHGQGYKDRDVTANLVKDYPKRLPGLINIGVLHTAVTGSELHARYAPCTPFELAALRYDYFALGHIHKRFAVNEGEFPAWFSGNLQGRSSRETGPKGVNIIDFTHGEPASVQFAPVDVVRWDSVEINVTGLPDSDTVFEHARRVVAEAAARAEGRLLSVRVTLTGNSPLAGDLQREDWLDGEIRNIAQGEHAVLDRARSQVIPPTVADAQAEWLRDFVDRAASGLSVELQPVRERLKSLDREIRDVVRDPGGVDALDFEDDAVLRNLLERARLGLAARLSGGGA